MSSDRERINILLVEDCYGNVSLVRKALENSNTRCRLQTVGIGDNTLSYLRKAAPYAEAPTPDLVFFDVSELRKDSLKLLEQIKADKTIASLPVVLLIGPRSEDLLKKLCIDNQDRTMFAPIDLDSFLKAMNSFRIDRFLGAVRLIESLGYVLVSLPETAENTGQSASCKSTGMESLRTRSA